MFWVPYQFTPTATGGQTGIAVVPSGSLTTAPVVIQNTDVLQLGFGYTGTLNAQGRINTFSAATVMYAAADNTGKVHIYGIDLTTTTLPVPHQISSLSITLPTGDALDQVICDDSNSGLAETNAYHPTTLFILLHLPGTTGCNTTGDTYAVVQYTDSAATAPHPVTVPTNGIVPQYRADATLAGIVMLDTSGATAVLEEYPYTAGSVPLTSTPVTILSGVDSAYTFDDQSTAGAAAFFDVVLHATPTIHKLYRLPIGSTTATLVFTEPTAGDFTDSADDLINLYFIDESTTGGGTTTQTVYQVPVAGGSMTTLFNNSFTSTTGQQITLIGSNGTVLMAGGIATTAGVTNENFYGLPIGTLTSTLPTTNLVHISGLQSCFDTELEPRTTGDLTTDLMLVNWCGVTGATTTRYTAIVSLGTTPNVLQNTLANSEFETISGNLGGSVIQIKNITDTAGSEGGGTLYNVNLSTLGATAMSNNGAAYTVPAGASPFLFKLSNQIGEGSYFATGVGLAFDLSKNFIIPITVTNTAVGPGF